MSNQAPLTLFLRALVAAKKSLALYPPASGTAMGWIEALRHSLYDAFHQGLIFPIRVGLDRFSWPGGELTTTDQGFKRLRFEMQSRGIAELSIEPSVENWELQALLELLNQPVHQFASTTAAQTYLRDRAVARVRVGALGFGGVPAPSGDQNTGWGTGTEESGSGPLLRSEEHTSELQSLTKLVCRLLLEKKKNEKSDPIAADQLAEQHDRDESREPLTAS